MEEDGSHAGKEEDIGGDGDVHVVRSDDSRGWWVSSVVSFEDDLVRAWSCGLLGE